MEFWIYIVVLFSSTIPLVFLLKSRGYLFLNSEFGKLIAFRFLTDILCFIFEIIIENSNPVFHFTLPINFYLIYKIYSKAFNLNSIRFPVFSIIIAVFCFEILNNSIMESNQLINVISYFLISTLGFVVIIKVPLNAYIKNVIFPIIGYYSILFFYSIFEEQIDKSIFLYDYLFYIFAAITLTLNIIFTRTIWLKKVI